MREKFPERCPVCGGTSRLMFGPKTDKGKCNGCGTWLRGVEIERWWPFSPLGFLTVDLGEPV